jgi:hypothetical protein
MRSLRVLVVAGLLFTCSARAGEFVHTLKKEPRYQHQPYYCLLTLGSEQKKLIWLVFDGMVLYVDKNGNGDLTEAGERLDNMRKLMTPNGIEGGVFDLGFIREDERTQHRVVVHIRANDVSAEMELQSGLVQSCGCVEQPSKSPKEAPVLNFNGPLEMQLGYLTHVASGSNRVFKRGISGYFLAASVMTKKKPNLTSGTPVRFVSLDGSRQTLAPQVNPVADIEFPGKEKPIKVRISLDQRFQGQFVGTVDVPAEAGVGTAKVTLSFPDCQGSAVAPMTFEVPVVDPDK